MTLDLYYMNNSPHCEAVLLTAKALDLKLNLIWVDLGKLEQFKPDFVKINPQHAIPVLVDNGFVLSESRAIMSYLAETYGKDDSLYPKDLKKRATVNQRLYFDMGTLYQRFADLYYPLMFVRAKCDPEKKEKLDEAYGMLNQYLQNSPWLAGDNITIADMTVAVTVANAVGVTNYNITPYPHVIKWFNNIKLSLQGYEEIVEEGIKALILFLDNRNIKRSY